MGIIRRKSVILSSISTKHLAEKVSQITGYPRKDVKKIIDTTFLIISDCLKRQIQVLIPKFGTFWVKLRLPRLGTYRKHKQPVWWPEALQPKFTFVRSMKDAIRKIKPKGVVTNDELPKLDDSSSNR